MSYVIEVKIKGKKGYFYYVREEKNSVVLDNTIIKAAKISSKSSAENKAKNIKSMPIASAIIGIAIKEFNGIKNPAKNKKTKLKSNPVKTKKPVKKNPIKKSVRKKPKINKNPDERIDKAAKRFETFTGVKPKHLDVFNTNSPSKEVGMKVGDLIGVIYSAKREGINGKAFIHKFKAKSRPILYASHDGSRIGIVGGKYEFLATHGIVDKD